MRAVVDDSAREERRRRRWLKMCRARHFIYALTDPRNSQVRYIGCCEDVVKRYAGHLAKPINHRVGAWLCELSAIGMKPGCITLIEADGFFEGRHLERIYIYEYEKYQGGLLNISNPVLSRERWQVVRWGEIWRCRMRRAAYQEVKHLLPPRPRNHRRARRARSCASGERAMLIGAYGKKVEAFGKRQNMAAWARELGISRERVRQRLAKYPPEIALAVGRVNAPCQRVDGSTSIKQRAEKPPKPPKPWGDRRKPTLCGFNREQRRERRRQMAEAIAAGRSLAEVAEQFDVTTTVVRGALKEFESATLVA